MPEELRQRRGKKNGELSERTKEEPPINITPVDQLRNAQARLAIARDRTADLHTAWRNQLFRLSLLGEWCLIPSQGAVPLSLDRRLVPVIECVSSPRPSFANNTIIPHQ